MKQNKILSLTIPRGECKRCKWFVQIPSDARHRALRTWLLDHAAKNSKIFQNQPLSKFNFLALQAIQTCYKLAKNNI